MRSIKQKLLVRILAMTAAAALICGGVGIAANYIQLPFDAGAKPGVHRIPRRHPCFLRAVVLSNAVRGLGMVPELSDGAVPVTEKERIVDHWAQSYGMERRQFAGFVGQEPV